MKIGLFGGSFDPVHEGHLEIASKAVRECELDTLVFLPCARSPLKEVAPIASDEQRLDMLDLAVRGASWAVVDRTDMDLPAPSWSWRVAEIFRERYPDADLYWLMGADQWLDLPRWAKWEYLAGMVTFIVHVRNGVVLPERSGIRAVFLEGDYPPSSSEIRARLVSGKILPAGWMNRNVIDYLTKNKIYG